MQTSARTCSASASGTANAPCNVSYLSYMPVTSNTFADVAAPSPKTRPPGTWPQKAASDPLSTAAEKEAFTEALAGSQRLRKCPFLIESPPVCASKFSKPPACLAGNTWTSDATSRIQASPPWCPVPRARVPSPNVGASASRISSQRGRSSQKVRTSSDVSSRRMVLGRTTP